MNIAKTANQVAVNFLAGVNQGPIALPVKYLIHTGLQVEETIVLQSDGQILTTTLGQNSLRLIELPLWTLFEKNIPSTVKLNKQKNLWVVLRRHLADEIAEASDRAVSAGSTATSGHSTNSHVK